MTAIEIVLIIAGLILMVGSFFIAEKLSPNELDKIAELSQEEIAHIVDKEIESSHDKVQEQLEAELNEVLAKLDQESDKETNEKIMAISEYSDTVIESINKSHNEIMFLYSMLGDKHKEVIDFSNELQERVEKLQKMVTEEMMVETMKKVEEEYSQVRSQNEPVIQMEAAPQMIENTPEEMTVPQEEEVQEPAEIQEEAVEKDISTNEKIRELYRQGMNQVDIAKELGIGLGIVRLVIELYEKEEPTE